MKRFNLQFVSDLHLEYSYKVPKIIAKQNNLALLGDIGNPRMKNYNNFLKYLSPQFDNIFLIAGNHEYWNLNYKIKYDKKQVDDLIEDICINYNNIKYMNNKSITIDNVHIIGNTLWSNIPNNKILEAQWKMGDCYNIYVDNKNILPYQINKFHKECVEYIENEININQDKKIIILSHHCPSYKYLTKKHRNYINNYAFVSNLDHLIERPVYAWLAGHTHRNIHKIINNVVCSINCNNYNSERYIEI